MEIAAENDTEIIRASTNESRFGQPLRRSRSVCRSWRNPVGETSSLVSGASIAGAAVFEGCSVAFACVLSDSLPGRGNFE